jgi:hypothetical protein
MWMVRITSLQVSLQKEACLKRASFIRSCIASAVLVAGSVAPLALAGPAVAADQCQHFTHSHYHFPYAHRDTHRYDGSHWHYDQRHWHHYYNVTHTTPYEKRC